MISGLLLVFHESEYLVPEPILPSFEFLNKSMVFWGDGFDLTLAPLDTALVKDIHHSLGSDYFLGVRLGVNRL